MQPSGFYVFRRPLLPVDALFGFLARTTAGPYEEELRRIFGQPQLQEAICLASPALFNACSQWLRGEEVAGKEKLLKTLFKYLLRASTRCTPYGMFAGCTPAGHFADHTRVTMHPTEPCTKYARLDMDYVAGLTRTITGHPDVQGQVKYFPNESLYRVGQKYRYTYGQAGGKNRQYSLCAVEASPYLETVLDASAGGAVIGEIALAVLPYGVDYEEAVGYVRQLVEEQVLVSEIQLSVTGPEFHKVLAAKLAGLRHADPWVQLLRYVHDVLGGQEHGVQKYAQVRTVLGPDLAPADAGSLVQTDLFFNTTENQLGKGVITSLTRAFQKLLPLNQGSYIADLETFRQRFTERYQDQEVPLLTALDGEVGIGYGGNTDSTGCLPLIEDLQVPGHRKPALVEWNYWKDFILRKYSGSLLAGGAEIVLTEADLRQLEASGAAVHKPLPASFAAFGNLLAESAEALDKGDFRFNLYSITGPSATNLLTRFAHGNPGLKAHIQACVAAEEALHPDAIFAEVVHLPEERTGNILLRPAFRRYEIPYLAQASVGEAFKIPLGDLMVSVRNGKEVVLRSVRHNKRVFPRLTTAHNFAKGLHPYRFLCDLQFQGEVVNVAWHWSILEKQAFLPRVRFENVIVSRAAWNLSADGYPRLAEPGLDLPGFFAEVRAALRLPELVTIAEADNEILVDFRNPYCLELLRDTLLKKNAVTLKEYLQGPGQCFLADRHGRYTNETIIPFQLVRPVAKGVTPPPRPASTPRNFSVGSEWLYFKVYAGEKTADHLLKKVFRPLAAELVREELVDQWFFVRYADPDFHLRIRYHGDPDSGFAHQVTDRLHAALGGELQAGLVHRVQTDTYQREIERYGDERMTLTEELFYHDSEAVAAFLSLLQGDGDEDYRGLFAMAGVQALLDDFGYPVHKRKAFYAALHGHYLAEFGGAGDLKRQLDEKYRRDRAGVDAWLGTDPEATGMKGRVEAILGQRSLRSRSVAGQIRAALPDEATETEAYLASCVHMFLNRVFISNPRLHELVVYHYLHKQAAARASRSPAILAQ
ncbi:MAG: Lanthionine biosynthesis protein LanB [uncultured Cytophagales bacterium]|uniref:Lanthionine biosynthesis protein LanB n=1 Tax=uncultured Cytophagales bacterium TaxID=158755 RepID=A0A6J4JNG1_9SPHI|nr:MAG: Lanthionine biosynthesis protein LanB [uncultured Cytophagales bacterium]